MCQMCNLFNPYGEIDLLDNLHQEPSEIEKISFANYDPQDMAWVNTGTPFTFSPPASDLSDTVETPYVPAYPVADFGDSSSVSGNGNPIIEGVLTGVQWTVGVTVTFSFPDQSTDYGTGYYNNANNQGFAQTTAQQQALIRAALDGETWFSFEGFTLANVVDLGDSADGMIRSAYSTTAGGSAYAFYPSDSEVGGDMWFNPYDPGDYYNYEAPVLGSASWRSTMHEIGHALGLSHGHTANGGFNALPVEYNNHEYSVMTYYSWEGKGAGGYTNDTYSHPQSFMMADIAALQYMYGADFTLNGGDTVYTFSDTTGEMFIDGVSQGTPGDNTIFLTLWDGNGIDTYDLSNYTNTVVITLEAGEASEFSRDQLADLGGGPNGGLARGNVYNALMYDDGTGEDIRSLIENAIGGSGSDMIAGNQVDNVLTGNGGHDALIGLEGDDTIYGGAGADLVLGAEDNDVLYGGDGDDRIYGDVYELPLGTGLIDDTTGALANTTLATAYSVDSEFTYDLWYVPSLNTEADEIVQHAGFTPYVTIGGLGQGNVMYYSFTILHDNTRVVLDIDGGNGLFDGGDFDSTLEVFNAAGTSLAYGDDSDTSDGSGGSLSTADSFIDMMIATAGVYYVAVDTYGGGGVASGSTFGLNISIYGEVAAPLVSEPLFGAGGEDSLFGGLGDDRLYGGDDNDYLSGDGGIDTLFGGSGQDELRGGGGADFVNGSGGNDYINGGGSNDLLVGGGGNDELIGGSGIDTIRGSSGADSMNGGSGIDTLSYSSDSAGVSINLEFNAASGGEATGDTIVNFENVIGGSGADTLVGDTGENALIGGGGNDVILGLAGDDRLVGGDGDDKIRGDEGADKMRGGAGNDTLLYNTDTTGVTVDIGNDTASGGHATGDDIAKFENIIGGSGNDVLYGTGGDNELEGNAGNDNLIGRNGNDVLIGGGGDDTLRGGGDTDTLTGGGGADVFEFVSGSDDDTITDFQVGIDTLKIFGLTSGDVSFSNAGGGDTLITLTSGDTILVENTSIAQLNSFSDFDFV